MYGIKNSKKMALLSSELASLCMIIVKTILRGFNYNCIEAKDIERHLQTNPCFNYLAILILEIISDLISFGVGED